MAGEALKLGYGECVETPGENMKLEGDFISCASSSFTVKTKLHYFNQTSHLNSNFAMKMYNYNPQSCMENNCFMVT